MLLNSRTTRLLLEAAEAAGVPRRTLTEPIGLDQATLVDPAIKVEWQTVVRVLERLTEVVGGDEERLREVGRHMARAPAYAPLRRIAGAVVSVRTLYDVANRFAAPSNFPHLHLSAEFVGSRMTLQGSIPLPYAAAPALFHVFEGSVEQLSTLLDLPPARVVERRVTPRTCTFVVELPASRSLAHRARLGLRAMLNARDVIAVLKEQQVELVGNVAALRDARTELLTLLDSLPDLVVVHRSERILWANGAFLEALGYALHDIVLCRPEDLIVERAVVRRDGDTIVPPSSGAHKAKLTELQLRTRNGETLTVEVAPPQRVVFEGVEARLLVGRDVTERRRMQQNLIVADRLASVGMLAAGVAHEVNNPLAYVMNNIEMVTRQLEAMGPAADPSRQALGVALEGVNRIRDIVRDLLRLARGDEGQLRDVDVRAVTESTLALAAHDIARTAHLVRNLENVPTVRASEGRVAQILLNLVSNALDAMRERPREQNQLHVHVAQAKDGRVLLEVRDTGSGVASSDMPRIFEPFYTTKPPGRGTGLGLSIAERLVSELGGEISASSTPGHGTSFRVLLPPGGVTRRESTQRV